MKRRSPLSLAKGDAAAAEGCMAAMSVNAALIEEKFNQDKQHA